MKRFVLLVISLAAMWASNAPASVFVTLDSVTEEGVGSGVWEWIYRASLQPDQTLRTNDFFTLYDVQSFISANFGAKDPNKLGQFFVTQQTPGDNPGGVPLTENAFPNFTVHYTGADIEPTAGAVTLGNLVVRSHSNPFQRVESIFGAQSINTGTKAEILNSGAVDVAAVPEPGSLTLMLVGLAAFGAVAFRRRRLID